MDPGSSACPTRRTIRSSSIISRARANANAERLAAGPIRRYDVLAAMSGDSFAVEGDLVFHARPDVGRRIAGAVLAVVGAAIAV